MGDERRENGVESQRRLEELSAQVCADRADIDALLAQADEANRRAEVNDVRAEDDRVAAQAREARARHDRRRIESLEARADLDRQMIAELQADGVVSTEHAAHLEEALRSSRRIGAAIGIVMANRKVSEDVAFEILRVASQHANRKVRVLADELVLTGDVSDLPGS